MIRTTAKFTIAKIIPGDVFWNKAINHPVVILKAKSKSNPNYLVGYLSTTNFNGSLAELKTRFIPKQYITAVGYLPEGFFKAERFMYTVNRSSVRSVMNQIKQNLKL